MPHSSQYWGACMVRWGRLEELDWGEDPEPHTRLYQMD